jgi:predicted PurR-regulated permease PerM
VERDPLVRGLLLMLAAIGTVWLAQWVWQVASQFADIILLFFLAWLLAFVLTPIARSLQRLGVRPLVAVGTVYAGLVLLLALVGLLVVPTAVAQLVQLGSSLPGLARDLQARGDQLHLSLIERGLPEAQLSDLYRNAINRAETVGTVILANSLTIATTVVSSLLRTTLVLMLSFYIMLDGDKIATVFLDVMPERYREDVAGWLETIDRTFGGFIRGQLIQATVYAVGTGVVMELAQLPYALVLSIFSGIMMVIPFIGPYLAIAPPVLLAVIVAPWAWWWVLLLLFVLQFVVINVLAPKIMSQSVGIHPLLVFAAVLVGAKLAGGWGAIFGVPLAAMLYLMARAFYQRGVLHMPLYRRGAPLSPDALVPSRSVHVDAHAGRLGGGTVAHGGHSADLPPAVKSPPPTPATPASAAPTSGA